MRHIIQTESQWVLQQASRSVVRKGRQTRAVIAIVPVIVALYEMPKFNSSSAGSKACMDQLNGVITTALCLDDRHINRWSVVPEFTNLDLRFQHILIVIWRQITRTDVMALAVQVSFVAVILPYA